MDEDEEELCEAIAEELEDYRVGDVAMGADHVANWAEQFDPDDRGLVLRETHGILDAWYVPRIGFRNLMENLTENAKVSGRQGPSRFWREANVLALQKRGSSQSDMLEVFDEALQEKHGFGLDDCGSDDGAYVYIDDGVFSGGTIKRDLRDWMREEDISDAKVLAVVAGLHQGGSYHVDTALKDELEGRSIQIEWFRGVAIEDRKYYIESSEVLRPKLLEGHEDVDDFVAVLQEKGYPPVWRKGGKKAPNGFSSDEARTAYEHVMLRVGARLRASCANPDNAMKPLGYTRLWTLGFGSLLVTFRNCPNNAPLAWWWGDPDADESSPLSQWYPLLPRKRPRTPDFRKLLARLAGRG